MKLTTQGQPVDLSAAADFLGNGAIEINDYESEITDLVRRSTFALQRFPAMPATGHPHRYFEQTVIATADAVDPRVPTATPSSPTRLERPAFIKAIVAQTNFTLFDREVTVQQGRFSNVIAKDINDILVAVQIKSAKMVWVGTDTSMSTPTTLEYMGALRQITAQATIALGASIIDGLKTQVAAMVADTTYSVMPTAIYLSPLLADLIDREARTSALLLPQVEVVAGVKVTGLSTQAGIIPLVSDPYIPKTAGTEFGFTTPGAGNSNYFAVIVSDDMVERPVISGEAHNPNPRLFQLGLVGGLSGQYVGLKFDTVIFKGPSYAHKAVAVVRAT